MNMILCIDDDGGILFNHRRVSRDAVLMQWISGFVSENPIWIAPYSKELFDKCRPAPKIMVAEDYLRKAAKDKDAYCFVEDGDFKEYLPEVRRIYLCKWNRRYPSDVKFPLKILKEYKAKNTWEFSGSSHEKITIDEWICK